MTEVLTNRFLLPSKLFQVFEIVKSTSFQFRFRSQVPIMLVLTLTLVSHGGDIGVHFRVECDVFTRTFVYDVNMILSW
ncbi:hypothetical protein GQ457_04G018200 [Hibiscus cannabinus]